MRVMVARSTDRGKRWKLVSTVAVDPQVGTEGFDEPVIARSTRGDHRNAAAMALLHRGVDLSAIALWLGHESTETTQIYLHADMQLKERALAHATSSGLAPDRFRPPDPLLAFLEKL